ncbi:hypothetical protein D3C80_2206860 [compost metagenome]
MNVQSVIIAVLVVMMMMMGVVVVMVVVSGIRPSKAMLLINVYGFISHYLSLSL